MNINTKIATACMASLVLTAPVLAYEPADVAAAEATSRIVSNPCLTTTGALSAVRDIARKDVAAAGEADAADDERVEIAEPAPGVINELIDLEGLPLVKLSDETEKTKIYFGISFDGVVGVHGKL